MKICLYQQPLAFQPSALYSLATLTDVLLHLKVSAEPMQMKSSMSIHL